MGAYLSSGGKLEKTVSLLPYLSDAKFQPLVFNLLLAPEEKRKNCFWDGMKCLKALTNLKTGDTILILDEAHHGDVLQGYFNVDPMPAIYETNRQKGFGRFVRWIFFAGQTPQQSIIGIDFNLGSSPKDGCATSFKEVFKLAVILAKQGIPLAVHIALLDRHMTENEDLRAVRLRQGLKTLKDWLSKFPNYRAKDYFLFCPRCGLILMHHIESNFCYHCGYNLTQDE